MCSHRVIKILTLFPHKPVRAQGGGLVNFMSSVSTKDMSIVATEHMSSVATKDMCFVETEDMSFVATDMSFVATEDIALKTEPLILFPQGSLLRGGGWVHKIIVAFLPHARPSHGGTTVKKMGRSIPWNSAR